jgi:hypothetical protein
MALQRSQVVSISRCAVAVGEGSSRQSIFSGGPPLSSFDMLLATEGFENLMLAVWPLRWSFVFLDMGPFILLFVFPLLWVLHLAGFHHLLMTWETKESNAMNKEANMLKYHPTQESVE